MFVVLCCSEVYVRLCEELRLIILMIHHEMFTTQHRRVFALRVIVHGSGNFCYLNSPTLYSGGEDSGATAHLPRRRCETVQILVLFFGESEIS